MVETDHGTKFTDTVITYSVEDREIYCNSVKGPFQIGYVLVQICVRSGSGPGSGLGQGQGQGQGQCQGQGPQARLKPSRLV